jgi:outer membrane protein OmpA-like peptidoglycan-associated protein
VARLLLANVHFEFDKADILPFYRTILDQVAQSLLQDDWRILEIELRGHTDAIASTEYNYRLGQRRADAVKDYLVSRGVSAARLVTKSYSELEPIAPNTKADGSDNPDGRALNRRVEMVPTSQVPAGRTTEIKILVRDVLFTAGKSDLSDEGRRYLDELAGVFAGQGFENVHFTITGRGTGRNRDDLARQRAQAVADYLATRGLAAERVSVQTDGTGNAVTIAPAP